MKMETKFSSVFVNDFDQETRTFQGYASVFNTRDEGGDIVEPGAFTASLLKWRGRGSVPPMLLGHDPARPVGRWTAMSEDAKGLRVEGKLTAGVRDAEDIYALLKDGSLGGLSIGYKVRRREFVTVGEEVTRHLFEIVIFEISLVSMPMHEDSVVTDVKNFDPRCVERALKAAGFSSSNAVTAVSVMKKYIRSDSEIGNLVEGRDDSKALKILLHEIQMQRANYQPGREKSCQTSLKTF